MAEQLGLLCVIEGSRLGGRVLASRVHPQFPAMYLSDAHAPREWRSFIHNLDAYGSASDEPWAESLIAGADRAFRLYAESAETAFSHPILGYGTTTGATGQ